MNKAGAEVDKLKGGFADGLILTGLLCLEMTKIRPGGATKDSKERSLCQSIDSRIVSPRSKTKQIQLALPGGLIGIGTKIDPTMCREDKLVGQVLGAAGNLLQMFNGACPSPLTPERLAKFF